MSGRLRRPAAAKASVKAAPKPAARAKAGLRRPAAAVEVEMEAEERQTAEERLLGGESIEAEKSPVGKLTQGSLLVVEGDYWGTVRKVCGEVKGVQIQGVSDMEVSFKAEGTDQEEFLKWISSNPTSKLRVHLCGKACPARVEAKDLSACSEGSAEGDSRRRGLDREPAGSCGRVGSSPSRRRSSSRTRTKKGGGKKTAKGEGQRVKEKREKKGEEKEGFHHEQRQPTKRQRFEKEDRVPEGAQCSVWDHSSVSGPTGSEEGPQAAQETFEEEEGRQHCQQRKLLGRGLTRDEYGEKRVGAGLRRLTQSEDHCKEGAGSIVFHYYKGDLKQLLTSAGTVWEQEKTQVPPLALQFYGSQLAGRLTGGAAREALTLLWSMDLVLQGKIAQAEDCMAQRLKSLEMTSSGGGPGSREGKQRGDESQRSRKRKRERKKRVRPGRLALRWQGRAFWQREGQRKEGRRKRGAQEELLGRGAEERSEEKRGSLLENGVGHRKTGTDITPGGPFESPGKDSKGGASIYSGRTLLEVGEPSRAVGSGTEVAPEVRLASGEKNPKMMR